MTNIQRRFLENVQSILNEDHRTKLTEDSLAFIMENVGIHNNVLKAELCFFNEDCGLEGVNSGILQILFTVSLGYAKDRVTELTARLDEVNKRIMLGSFHVYEPFNHIVFRYGLPIPDLEAPDALQTLFVVLAKMSDELELLFNYILIIADDVDIITLDEYLEELNIIRMAIADDPDFVEEFMTEGAENE